MYVRTVKNLMSIVCFYTVYLVGSAGTLDITFNALGSLPGTANTTVPLGSSNSSNGYGVALQQDGKIVVAGDAVVDGEPQFAVVRYNTDGTPDLTFNASDTPGTNITMIGSAIGSATASFGQAVAIQQDGKIVLAGYAFPDPNTIVFAVARFNVNGTIDATFNPSGSIPGTATINAGVGVIQDSQAFAVAIQSDGKIVLAGAATFNGPNTFAVARFNANGTPDTTFNGTGTALINVGVSESKAFAVAIQPDGKIVLAGLARSVDGSQVFGIARFNTNGTPDITFNGTGTAVVEIAATFGGDSAGQGVALQKDGKIVVSGYAELAPQNFAVARLNTDGTLDTTFNASGDGSGTPGTNVTTIDGLGEQDAFGRGVVIQPNGKIVIAGQVVITDGSGLPDNFAIARFTSDGLVDATFNASGSLPGTANTTIAGPSNNSDVLGTQGVALQQNGKIVMVGTAVIDGLNNFGIARFNGDPQTTNPCALQLIEKYGLLVSRPI